MENLRHYLEKIIPYRLYAIRVFRIALSFVDSYPDGGEYICTVNGEVKLRGRSTAITNPTIEIGIIHSRVLLEFLGLKASDSSKLNDNFQFRSSDVHIEKYGLSRVTIKDALKPCESNSSRAEQALAETITAANKLVAHSTNRIDMGPEAIESYLIASQAIPVLYNLYFYQKLGIEMPDIEVHKTQSTPNNWFRRIAKKLRFWVTLLRSAPR